MSETTTGPERTMPVHTGRISDEELARVRGLIGKQVEVRDMPYLTEATRDAIRHWVAATGDRNPLYTDEAYARGTRHGSLLAPPSILYAFSRLSIGYRGGLPGVHSMFGGSHWRWKEPVRLGQVIDARATFKDLEEMPSRFAGRMFKQISTIAFATREGVPLAEVDSWGFRMERTQAKEKGKYKALEFKQYTKEEIDDIAERLTSERCRGADPLRWEDVQAGDVLPEIIRGPYTATVAVAFEQAWGGLFVLAHGYWFDYLKRHPAAAILNHYGIPEPPEAVHWDSLLAKSVGVPEAYDYGPERISWLTTLMTNWIGDAGFLEELYCEIRRFNLIGDLTTCRGSVISVEPLADGQGRIKVAIEAVDQRGQTTAKGWAQALLPGRG